MGITSDAKLIKNEETLRTLGKKSRWKFLIPSG